MSRITNVALQIKCAFAQVRGHFRDKLHFRWQTGLSSMIVLVQLKRIESAISPLLRRMLISVQYVHVPSRPFSTLTSFDLLQKPATRQGFWFSKLLYKGIKAMWFSSAKDDGVRHPEYFKPIPVVTIALVFTAVGPSLLLFLFLANIFCCFDRSASVSMSREQASSCLLSLRCEHYGRKQE